MNKKSLGYTLIELSLFIIIIGLVIVAVISSKDIIHNALIRSQIVQIKKFDIATNSFILKYGGLPGDLVDAKSYWPEAENGDGNGKMSHPVDYIALVGLEGLKFFHHLSLSELIDDKYNNTWELGVGFPSLVINPNNGMMVGNNITNGVGKPHQLSDDSVRNNNHRIALYLNVSLPSSQGEGYNDDIGVLTPQHAFSIDNKIDDGFARSGIYESYRAKNSIVGNCLKDIEGDYDLSITAPSCMSQFVIFN